MSRFLTDGDYDNLIEGEDLDLILQDEPSILSSTELQVQEEISSYTRQRYDVAAMFPNVTLYSFTTSYSTGNVIYINADPWVNTTTYAQNDMVVREKKVYKSDTNGNTGNDPITSGDWTFIGNQHQVFIAIDASTGVFPTDDTKWGPDPRSKLLIRFMVDLTLYEIHSRIMPRNIPDHRVVRAEDARRYLNKVRDPRSNLTPDFPLKTFEDQEGNDATWNSAPKYNNADDLW